MTAEKYKTNTGAEQFRPRMTTDEYREASNNNEGFCLACGETADGVEPDARRYECEVCGQHKVYGFEELLMMGLVVIE